MILVPMLLFRYIIQTINHMKSLFLSLSIILSCYAIAQQNNSVSFSTRLKSDQEKIIENPVKIKADEVYMISFGVSLDPKSIEGLDNLEIIMIRDGGEKLVFTMTTSYFLTNAGDDPLKKGNKIIYPKVVNYRDFPETGESNFFSVDFNKKMGADFFLSKKGTDYSNSVSKDEYILTGYVNGYKFVGYVREKDLNGEYQNVAKYGPAVTLSKLASVKIVTSDKIAPMPKTDSVGDVQDLMKIGE